MGGAMLRGWIASGMAPAGFLVVDPGKPALPGGVAWAETAPDGQPQTLLLAVKPQMLGSVAPGLAAHIGPGTTLLSILAGVEATTLRAAFPNASRTIRVMPNTPAAIRKGVLALHGEEADDITALMTRLGLAEWITDEALFDAVTALSGSGPAFLYRFIDALAAGGAALGLPADQALRLATATVEGAALLAAASDEPPSVLADRVASPGGSTREGLNVLDDDNAMRRLLAHTLVAATKRNAELAAAALQV
jgi:pyrroline-5-carboxylate reductase